MTQNPARSRTFGWLMAGVSSAAILSGAAALALVAEAREEPAPMMLDLSLMPSTAPNVAAGAEEAPQVLDEVTEQSEPPEMEPPPELETDTAPDLPMQSALSLPQIDKPVVADLSLPPPPEEPVKEPEPEKPVEKVQKAEKKPEKKPDPKPKKEKPKKKVETAEKVEKTEKPKEEASQAAAKAGAAGAKAGKAKGGSKMSPAAYSKAVMKKVRSTKKKKVKARGVAVVAFSVGRDGGLAGARIARSSGDAELDRVAVEHIHRSAPFPVPPEGAERNFQIEFAGK